uniref:BTB domain-containing protein n=1 Tax=Panagrolaimus sp. PS1159 TaxID=55785 RepID=A0AC35FEB4_9BILA
MLSSRLSTNDKVVKVEDYSYDDFFVFVSFLYSGKCNLTNENILRITDMAEYYGVSTLKNYCDLFLSKMSYTETNVFDMIEFGQRYSLPYFNESLRIYYFDEFDALMRGEKFLTLKHSCIELLAAMQRHSWHREEQFFEAVCKWAKHQILLRKESEESAVCLPEEVKEELIEIIPHIKFKAMSFHFASTFLVEHQYLFTPNELYDILLSVEKFQCKSDEEKLVKLIFELAEKEVKKKEDESFDFNEAVKMELSELLPRIKFHKMSYKFLMDFLVDKQFLFSLSEMCKVLVKSQRYCSAEDEDLFKTVYEIIENQALQKQTASSDIDFNLNEAIKSEMTDFDFYYYNMSLEFVLEYIVPKKFLFASQKLYDILLSSLTNGDVEKLFDAIYELAETEATEKQFSAADDDFNLENAIKDELRGILPKICFSRMSLEYINDKIVRKKFLFSASELYKYLLNSKRTHEKEEEFFKAVYELAEEYALKKQEIILSENFDLKAAVKEELNEIIPKVKFSSMKLDFLADFVAELYKFFVDFKDQFENEEMLLEAIYKLAEAQAHEKEKTAMAAATDETFNLVNTIKADLADILPKVQFYKMNKTYLEDFVVKNGILSDDDVNHIFDYRVVIDNGGLTLTGTFVDTFGIKDRLGTIGYRLPARATYKQRFTRLKFTVPSTPSTLEKMKGVEWYLLLEKDGTLTIKSANNIAKSGDYLIAELRSQNRFELLVGSPTTIKSFSKSDN